MRPTTTPSPMAVFHRQQQQQTLPTASTTTHRLQPSSNNNNSYRVGIFRIYCKKFPLIYLL
jgi:hypothetical protein